jgi:membrane associated rhomboid family serine protease
LLPLRDNLLVRRPPYAIYAVVAAVILGFAAELYLGDALPHYIQRLGLIPEKLWRPERYGATRLSAAAALFTSLFLHGSWPHLLGNLWFLAVFGRGVEGRLGHGRFLLLYFACGVSGGICQVLASPGAALPVIGASGAIAGVLGAYLALFPRARVLALVPLLVFYPVLELPAALFLGVWAWLQLASGYAAILEPGGVSIAWFAHLGGFGSGAILAALLKPRAQVAGWRYSLWEGLTPEGTSPPPLRSDTAP